MRVLHVKNHWRGFQLSGFSPFWGGRHGEKNCYITLLTFPIQGAERCCPQSRLRYRQMQPPAAHSILNSDFVQKCIIAFNLFFKPFFIIHKKYHNIWGNITIFTCLRPYIIKFFIISLKKMKINIFNMFNN